MAVQIVDEAGKGKQVKIKTRTDSSKEDFMEHHCSVETLKEGGILKPFHKTVCTFQVRVHENGL